MTYKFYVFVERVANSKNSEILKENTQSPVSTDNFIGGQTKDETRHDLD